MSHLVLVVVATSFLCQTLLELGSARSKHQHGGGRREVRAYAVGGALSLMMLAACAVALADPPQRHLLAWVAAAAFALHAGNRAAYRHSLRAVPRTLRTEDRHDA